MVLGTGSQHFRIDCRDRLYDVWSFCIKNGALTRKNGQPRAEEKELGNRINEFWCVYTSGGKIAIEVGQ